MAELQTTTGDVLRLQPEGAKFEVDLGGIPILGSFARGDRKIGVTHPCTPIFGPDRKQLYGLKQHGDMRNQICEIHQREDAFVILHRLTDVGYPMGILVSQELRIASGVFQLTMTHTNKGDTPAALNAGEHCYFAAPQGFAGTIINDIDITDLVKNNYDGIAITLQEKNTIQIPGKPTYELLQRGLKKAVVWVGKNPETKALDQSYICIEPVEDDPFGEFFGSPESMISPGNSRSFTFTLHIQ